MKKIGRRTKLKIGKVVGFLMYSIGAGVAIGAAELIGRQDGYDEAMRDVRNAPVDTVIFKEDK